MPTKKSARPAPRPRSKGASSAAPDPAPADEPPRLAGHRVDARPDTVDFRDRLYEPTLVEVPAARPLALHRALGVPVLDQGREGACTGFALATVAHTLLRLRDGVDGPPLTPVSARMLYEMARRYDEWPGEAYSGSSARGAMKGWYKHGVCSELAWPAALARGAPRGLTDARLQDALGRPLGAYLRVNHRDLVALHAALAEARVLYATAAVHTGWEAVGLDGRIPPGTLTGAHAFAIVGHDAQGFWLQNSWGTGWGHDGFGHLPYDDWLAHGTDVWVARLGAPVVLSRGSAASRSAVSSSGASEGAPGLAYAALRPHVVNVGNEGRLQPRGDLGMDEHDLAQIFRDEITPTLQGWATPRLLLYAHGGLVSQRSALQRLAELRALALPQQVWPLGFVWHTDLWSTVTNVLEDAVRRRRPEGVFDAARDFLLDRLDDTLELLVRPLGGRVAWDEMKENARGAARPGHAAARVAAEVAALKAAVPGLQLHLVGHSAGAIFQAGLLQRLCAAAPAGEGLAVDSVTLWAPACTTALLHEAYLPGLDAGQLGQLALYVLDDATERDDHCARIYNKSLLYLVSQALEAKRPTPLAGLWRDLEADPDLARRFRTDPRTRLVVAPNARPDGDPWASRARAHGAFDDDSATVRGLLARLTGAAGPAAGPATAALVAPAAESPAPGPRPAEAEPLFARSAASRAAQRDVLKACWQRG